MLDKIKKINSNPGMIVRRDVEQMLSKEILNAELELKEMRKEMKSYSGNADKVTEYNGLLSGIEKALQDKGFQLISSANAAKITKCEIDLDPDYPSELSLTGKIALERNLQMLKSLEPHLDSIFERSKMSVSIDMIEDTLKNEGSVAAEWLLRSVEKDYEAYVQANKLINYTHEERMEIGQTLSDLRDRIIKLHEQQQANKQKPNQSPQQEMTGPHTKRLEEQREKEKDAKRLGGPTSCSSGCLIM